MANKRCFFVVGPEGSGTYMMAEALVEAGCFYIPEELDSDFDKVVSLTKEQDIVIRRSIPHRGEFIDLYTIASVAKNAGYDVQAIAIFREPNATALSVRNRNGTPQHFAIRNMIGAMTCISELDTGFSVLPITYEAVVGSYEFTKWLFNYLELSYPHNYVFYDGNEKYYE